MPRPFFFFTIAALALGCGPGPDPNLGPCPTRKPGAVVLGTGEDDFTPIPSAGVPINYGMQGGQHIWLGLSCQNLGPRVTARFKITDVETGIELSQPGLAQALDLEYDGKGSDLGYGIYGYLKSPYELAGSNTSGGDDGSGGGSSTSGSGGAGGSGGDVPMLPSDLTGRKIKMEVDVTDECKAPAVHAEVLTVISSG